MWVRLILTLSRPERVMRQRGQGKLNLTAGPCAAAAHVVEPFARRRVADVPDIEALAQQLSLGAGALREELAHLRGRKGGALVKPELLQVAFPRQRARCAVTERDEYVRQVEAVTKDRDEAQKALASSIATATAPNMSAMRSPISAMVSSIC